MTTRREAVRVLAILGAVGLLRPRAWAEAASDATSDKLGRVLPRRSLGRTGLRVTMITVGGSHIGRPSELEGQRIIEAAIESGVRTFETAQLYQNGGSEERYGNFLTPKYRDHVQVFTKTMATDARTAASHLDGSLRRMKLDYLDLWQMHDVANPEDFDRRRREGVVDFMERAKASGKVRHIGFTGHATWRAHAHVLKSTDVFETCQMPVNVADVSYESFILNVMPLLVEREMGVLAMKTLAAGDFLRGRGSAPGVIPDLVSIQEALRYVWSLPVSTLVSGMAQVAHVKENTGYAANFVPMSGNERQAIVDRISHLAQTGVLEAGFKDHRAD